MRLKKHFSWLTLIVFIWTIVFSITTPAAYASSKCTDINNHWAQGQIEELISGEIVHGYPDGTFKPDKTITRAEFITIVNQAFKYNENTTAEFIDVKPTDWFAGEISRARAAGYISGYEDGSIKPNNNITRQEAAAMVARILKLAPGSADSLSKFKDADKIPSWAQEGIASIIVSGCMSGYPDQTFRPQNNITRAEAAVTIGLAMGKIAVTLPVPPPTTSEPDKDLSKIEKAGTYGPETGSQTMDNNSVISAAGVVVQNVVFKGDLLIADSVGSGDVTLKNITVEGTTSIQGGGNNSIKIENAKLNTVNINKKNDELRVVLSENTTIKELIAHSAVKVVGQATIEKATIYKNGVNIEPSVTKTTVASGVTAIIGGKNITGTASGGGGGGGGGGSTTNQVALPAANLSSGPVIAGTSITLTCGTAGAAIRYTLDGSEPGGSSTIYTTPIIINATTTVKAKAFKAGMTDSNTAVFTYTVGAIPPQAATPAANPPSGQVKAGITVALTCSTTGATIYYTLDGSEPTASSTKYSAPINLGDKNITIKAIAVKEGMQNSPVLTAAYTIQSAVQIITSLDEPGTYPGDYQLNNLTRDTILGPATGTAHIEGTLYLDPGTIYDLTLRNITAGNIEVLSGKTDSITLLNVGVLTLLVIRDDSGVRIVTQGDTSVAGTSITCTSNTILEVGTGTSLGQIEVNAAGEIILKGDFATSPVTVAGDDATIRVADGASVPSINVAGNTSIAAAPTATVNNIAITGSNQVTLTGNLSQTSVDITGNNAALNIAGGASVGTMNISSNSTVSTGSNSSIGTVNVQTASTVNLTGSGQVSSLTVGENAGGATLDINANVGSLQTAANITIQGAQASQIGNIEVTGENTQITADDQIINTLIAPVKAAAEAQLALIPAQIADITLAHLDAVTKARSYVNAIIALAPNYDLNNLANYSRLAPAEPVVNQLALNSDRDTLTISFGGTDTADSVTGNITLPTRGAYGSIISWQSANATVVAASGTVNPPDKNDVTVILTATLTRGGVTATRDITIIVKAKEKPKAATPTASPAPGAVAAGTTVTLSTATEGAAIHYTTDDSTPTETSAVYSNAIPIKAATTIKAIAVKSNMLPSDVAVFTYTITTQPSDPGGDNNPPPIIPVSGISVTGAGNATTVVNGGTLQMSAAVLPANATNKTVTWSVATLVGGTATINATTGLLTATGVGTVTVKATAQDGSGVVGEKVITIQAAQAGAAVLLSKISGYGMPTSKVKVQINSSFINTYTLYFDGAPLASTTNGIVTIATAVLNDLSRVEILYNNSSYTTVDGGSWQ